MRIASLISAGTEMLFALGLGDSVVAVSHECDWPPGCARLPRISRSNINAANDSRQIDQEVSTLLAAGQPLYELDLELLVELEPDLIVTQGQCDVCAISTTDVLAAVKGQQRLSGATLFSLNPTSFDDVLQEMLRLGTATGVAQRATEVVSQLRRRIEKVRHVASEVPKVARPRTAIIEWTEPLMLAGNWVPELLDLAGGRCELTPPRKPSRFFTWDELVRFDPEVIVVCPCGFDLERSTDEARALTNRPNWNSLAAVRADRVFAADGNACFNRPGPRLVDSLEALARVLREGTAHGPYIRSLSVVHPAA